MTPGSAMSWRRSPIELVDDAMLRPDSVDAMPAALPVAGGYSRGPHLTGIRALMLAVLEDGVRCYLGSVSRTQTEAEYWVTAGRRDWPFCFATVCEVLGLDTDAARLALLRMRTQRLPQERRGRRIRPNARRPGPLTS